MSSFKEALKTGDLDRILVCKGNLLPTDKISVNDNSLIVEQLVKNDRLNDATKIVKTMLSEQTHPIPRIFRFYLNKVAAGGDISAMKEIGDKLSADTKKLLSFDNRFCHANIVAGKSGDYLKQLEIDIDNAKTTEEIKEVGEKFPRGGAVGILDSLPGSSAHFEQVAGKYAEKGLLGPMNVLWMHHFINANNMDADRLWDKYLKDAPRLMFQRVVHLAREKQDSDLVERLIKLLKTAKVSEGALGNAYSCLLDIQSTKNDFEAAMKSLENAIKDVCLENINRTALLRIKEGVEKAGNVFPYVIHNASNNSKNLQSSSSSSSSSSDEEVTAKRV
jgi:leucine-rich PPR motif-containing protein